MLQMFFLSLNQAPWRTMSKLPSILQQLKRIHRLKKYRFEPPYCRHAQLFPTWWSWTWSTSLISTRSRPGWRLTLFYNCWLLWDVRWLRSWLSNLIKSKRKEINKINKTSTNIIKAFLVLRHKKSIHLE